MIDELKNLKEKFITIKKRNWIKSMRKGYTGIGYTFEKMLGKNEDSNVLPDYNGIEIKTKRAYSKSYTTLFNIEPKGNTTYEIKRLYEKYGYISPQKKTKVLYASVYSNIIKNVGIKYKFSLKIDKANKKINLQVFDKMKNMIDNSSYWDFDIIKEKLYKKMEYLALIKANRKIINNEEFFKYENITFYKLKDFDTFINILEKGIIRMTFKVSGIYTEGKKEGLLDNHGTSLNIKSDDLKLIYDEIKI